MLAGRPHEAAGNGSPRWMTAAPRERAHRTRPTGRLTPIYPLDLPLRGHDRSLAHIGRTSAGANIASSAPRPCSLASGNRCPYVSMVSAIVAAVPGSVQELTARARELRVAAGVSQRAMAAHAGVAQSTIASWETGRITAPGVARSRA